MIEIAHIPGKEYIVVDDLSRYPQENGPSYEHLVDQEGIRTRSGFLSIRVFTSSTSG